MLDYLQVLLLEHRAPDRMVQALDDALDACRVVNGRLTPDPDWGVRLKAVQLVRGILGLGPKAAQNEPPEVIQWAMEHDYLLPNEEEPRKLLGDGKTKGEAGE